MGSPVTPDLRRFLPDWPRCKPRPFSLLSLGSCYISPRWSRSAGPGRDLRRDGGATAPELPEKIPSATGLARGPGRRHAVGAVRAGHGSPASGCGLGAGTPPCPPWRDASQEAERARAQAPGRLPLLPGEGGKPATAGTPGPQPPTARSRRQDPSADSDRARPCVPATDPVPRPLPAFPLRSLSTD
jgi:hypothetical protein